MRATKVSHPNLSLDAGSTKRAQTYQVHLKADRVTTPVFDDKAENELLKWAIHPDRILDEIAYLDSLVNEDGEQFARSNYNYGRMKDSTIKFTEEEKSSFQWNHHYQKGLSRVKARFSDAHLTELKYHCDDDIINSVTDWSTSPGWQKITLNARKKRDLQSNIYQRYTGWEQQAKLKGSFEEPLILGHRGQASGEYNDDGSRTGTFKLKDRAVEQTGMGNLIAGRSFVKPLMDWMKYQSDTAVGKTDKWIWVWTSQRRALGWSGVSLDYSKYDSTIPSWLIFDAFEVIRCAFDELDAQLFEIVRHDFIYKYVLLEDGFEFWSHGDPSGSAFTTVINCICNEIMTETWADKFNTPVSYNVMGDDNLIYFTSGRRVELSDIASYLMHNFGVEVNVEKSENVAIGAFPEYLSRLWRNDGPWRPWQKIVSLMMFPENYRDYNRRGSTLTPQLIIFSYILAYTPAMREIMDVDGFLTYYRFQQDMAHWSREQLREVPYNVRLVAEQVQEEERTKRMAKAIVIDGGNRELLGA